MIRKYLLKLEKSKKKDPKKVKQNVKCKIHIETKAQTVKKMQNPCRNKTPIAKKKKKNAKPIWNQDLTGQKKKKKFKTDIETTPQLQENANPI